MFRTLVTRAASATTLVRPAATPVLRLTVRGYASAPRRYTKDHEWVAVNDQGIATMGISDYAAKALGDVVYAELPEVGKLVSVKDPVGAVESVKAASDVYAPVSGEIVEANAELEGEPGLINEDSFGQGWICKIKLANPKELDALLDEAAYKAHTEE